MLTKKAGVTIGIILICLLFILFWYVFRLERFGFAKIDWVDCVQINGTTYYKDYINAIDESTIDKKIGDVKFNVAKNVNNPNYKLRDGDATFIEPGTEIYSLKEDINAIAVKNGKYYYLYKKNTWLEYEQLLL